MTMSSAYIELCNSLDEFRSLFNLSCLGLRIGVTECAYMRLPSSQFTNARFNMILFITKETKLTLMSPTCQSHVGILYCMCTLHTQYSMCYSYVCLCCSVCTLMFTFVNECGYVIVYVTLMSTWLIYGYVTCVYISIHICDSCGYVKVCSIHICGNSCGYV